MTGVFIIVSGLVSGLAVWLVLDWRTVAAERELQLARAIREQAAEILDQSERHEAAARAMFTPTAEHPVITATVKVRAAGMWQDVRDWAASLGPDTSPDWAEGEIKALTPKPPLRKRGSVADSRRSWPIKRPIPTPGEIAQRLASHYDPTRQFRVNVRLP